ncbi:unnamed protein product [Ophioblennius macclurei]
MALQKKVVVFAVLTAVSLLCAYVLRTWTWSLAPLGTFHRASVWTASFSEEFPPPPDLERPPRPSSTSTPRQGPAATTRRLPNAPAQGRNVTAGPPKAPPKPTEPPFIGDSYMTANDPPLTDCADSIRRRVGQTEFGSQFLERIPVLQWSRDATPAEHRRLSRYPGAHGWGGVDYTTLVQSLAVLNSSANGRMLDDWRRRGNGSECVRCAVVGNGGILKDSGKGKEIDAHHYVFRTNGAIIKGFEKDVGSRTTHYTFSTNTLMNSMRSYAKAGYKGPPVTSETRYVFLPDHDRDYLLVKAAASQTAVERGPDKGKSPFTYFGKDVSAEKLKMYHPDFIRYLRNRFLRSTVLKTKYKDIYRPSTGATMLLAALHTCDQVNAYGFMTPDYARYSDHYYDGSFHPVGFFVNHDLRLEMALWQRLNKAGLMRLYMHQQDIPTPPRLGPPSQ